MAAQNTDKFKKLSSNTGWQLGAAGISDSIVTNFSLISATGLPTDTAVVVTVDRVDSSGTHTPSKMERIAGVLSGNNVTSCIRGYEGTAQAHAGGAVVEILIVDKLWNDVMDGILAEHNQDGTHSSAVVSNQIHSATVKAMPVDADEFGFVDSAASWVLKKITFLALKLAIYAGIKPADGTVWNGKIVPTVAANNLTLTLKTLSGADPSSIDPVYATIGGIVRTITAPLSKTINAGANTFGKGASYFVGVESDLFAYLLWNTTDSAVSIGISADPSMTSYSEFSSTATAYNYLAYSGSAPASTDYCINIGRFGAILGASATYYWSLPTFTALNLIQRPSFETRTFSFTNAGAGAGTFYYKQVGKLKYCFGVTTNLTVTASSSTAFAINNPGGFFTGILSATCSAANMVTNIAQFGNVSGCSVGSITGYIYNSAALSGTCGWSCYVIGY